MDEGQPRHLAIVQEGIIGQAFEHAPIAVIVLDYEGHYVAINKYASDLTGYTREELFELGPQGVVVEQEVAPRPIEEARRLRHWGGTSRVRRKDGAVKEVEYRLGHTTIGRAEFMIAVWWDVPPRPGSLVERRIRGH